MKVKPFNIIALLVFAAVVAAYGQSRDPYHREEGVGSRSCVPCQRDRDKIPAFGGA